jgi:serine/threonine protein kinase
LPEARAKHILMQVCGSLAEAHALGLVHRDIKPANIVLTRRGGLDDFVKVLDFGLVKSLEGSDAAHVTAANAVTGTPLYLSPEAIRQPDRVDARSDVYAIGAVGYFLVTGSPVFSGGTVVDICMAHVNEQPESPSARARRIIDPQLEALILRCLSKLPGDRPADAAELLRALDVCESVARWSVAEAAAWWAAHGTAARSLAPTAPTVVAAAAATPAGSATIAYDGQTHEAPTG